MDLCFFDPSGDPVTLLPRDMAASLWRTDQMHGVAVCGALARAADHCRSARGRSDLRGARFTVDLFRPAGMEECTTTAEVVRDAPRIMLVDARLHQGGETVARASAVFLKPSAETSGEVWQPDARPTPPPASVKEPGEHPDVPYLRSDGAWSQDFTAHQNAARHTLWQTAVPVVQGERPSAFVAAASIADSTSMVTHWGSEGVEYINTDATLTLSRLPVSHEIGLVAADRSAHEGVAVSAATMFDREGVIGTSVVTALANTRRTVDLSQAVVEREGAQQPE